MNLYEKLAAYQKYLSMGIMVRYVIGSYPLSGKYLKCPVIG